MGRASRRKRHRISTLDEFTRVAAHECRAIDRTTVESVLFFGHSSDVLCLAVEWGDTEAVVAWKTDQLFASRPRWVGLASQTRWSPDEATDFEDAWMLVTVERGEAAARLTVNWPAGSPEMHNISMVHAPWIAASTAGSLRKALAGEPPTFRRGTDARLFNRVRDEEPPPTHKDGKL
jgi:hypothetical protein